MIGTGSVIGRMSGSVAGPDGEEAGWPDHETSREEVAVIWFLGITVAALVLAALVEYLLALAAASRAVPVPVHPGRHPRRSI